MAPPIGTKHKNRKPRKLIYPVHLQVQMTEEMQTTLFRYATYLQIKEIDVLRAFLTLPVQEFTPKLEREIEGLPITKYGIYPVKLAGVISNEMADSIEEYMKVLHVSKPDIIRAFLLIPPQEIIPAVQKVIAKLPTVNTKVNKKVLDAQAQDQAA